MTMTDGCKTPLTIQIQISRYRNVIYSVIHTSFYMEKSQLKINRLKIDVIDQQSYANAIARSSIVAVQLFSKNTLNNNFSSPFFEVPKKDSDY